MTHEDQLVAFVHAELLPSIEGRAPPVPRNLDEFANMLRAVRVGTVREEKDDGRMVLQLERIGGGWFSAISRENSVSVELLGPFRSSMSAAIGATLFEFGYDIHDPVLSDLWAATNWRGERW